MKRRNLVVAALLMSSLAGYAKDKKLNLPVDVLRAQTVLVVIDPNAGVDIQDPNANHLAQVDVEQALMKWGRFSLVNEAISADLIITVSKGNGKIVQPTIGGVSQNNRPGVLQANDSTVRVGGRQGNTGNPGDPSNPQANDPHPETTIGPSQDMFVVYRSNREDPRDTPLDSPPAFRYTSKDALHSPDVPAVDEFRKAIAEAEKKQAGKP